MRVDRASKVKQMIFMQRDETIRYGYDAFFCNLVSASMEPRLVSVETDISADWKWVKIHLCEENRC
jgi:hypothetical protein